MFRVLASFAALPAVPAFLAYYVLGADGWDVAIYFMSVYPVLAAVGLPLFFIARSKFWLSGWHFVVLGSLVAIATVAVFLVPAMFRDLQAEWTWLRTTLRELAVVGACGAVHGLLLWVLGVWNNSHLMRERQSGA